MRLPSALLSALVLAALPAAAAAVQALSEGVFKDLDDMDHFEPGLRNERRHTPLEVTVRGVLALAPALR